MIMLSPRKETKRFEKKSKVPLLRAETNVDQSLSLNPSLDAAQGFGCFVVERL